MLAVVDCCDPNGLNRMFAGPIIRWELEALRRRGLNSRHKKLLAALEAGTPGMSVLDIGCGIGTIGTTLLKNGASSGVFVDISAAYLKAAREVVADASVAEKAAFVQDNFATSARSYAAADVVVLDRVVCCYPDAIPLLEKAARHSQQTLVFTYPRPFWVARLFRTLCAFGMRLLRREYRFFLHDPQALVEAATSAGHEQVVTRSLGVWQLVKVSKH